MPAGRYKHTFELTDQRFKLGEEPARGRATPSSASTLGSGGVALATGEIVV
jgi:hypothetical protein